MASYIAQLTSTPAAQPDEATAAQPLATFGANSAADTPPADPCVTADGVSDEHWVCAHLSRDAISPALAWLMFVEAPWSLLRFDLGWNLLGWHIEERDRARVLEESWELAWQPQASSEGLATNLFALNALADTDRAHVPLLVFNGTTVESGCRMNTSVLKSYEHAAGEPVKSCLDATNPAPAKRVLGATLDLVDFLCKSDKLPLSKAALLSARFPLISPSGRITQCLAESPTVADTKKLTEALETYVVDGGYLENSGADTALELWLALQPLVAEHNKNNALPPIVPFFIQIDNGYAEPAAQEASHLHPSCSSRLWRLARPWTVIRR